MTLTLEEFRKWLKEMLKEELDLRFNFNPGDIEYIRHNEHMRVIRGVLSKLKEVKDK
jgi:hypothetical protein